MIFSLPSNFHERHRFVIMCLVQNIGKLELIAQHLEGTFCMCFSVFVFFLFYIILLVVTFCMLQLICWCFSVLVVSSNCIPVNQSAVFFSSFAFELFMLNDN